MIISRSFVFLVKLCFLICLVKCGSETDSNEIHAEELVQGLHKYVSSTLERTRAQLRLSHSCGSRQDSDYPLDCAELLLSGKMTSGVYLVQPLGFEEPFEVFCDMATDSGGWTVFQRRGDYGNPEDYFYKNWKEYKEGFGHLRKEFWLGNDKISALSLQRDYQLRVDLQDMDRNRTHAKYDMFWMENEDHGYQLYVSDYSGDAGDSLIEYHSTQNFSTKDRGPEIVCAEEYKGAWWYNDCHSSNLNGLNLKGTTTNKGAGIVWYSYKNSNYSLYSEMKIKPTVQ